MFVIVRHTEVKMYKDGRDGGTIQKLKRLTRAAGAGKNVLRSGKNLLRPLIPDIRQQEDPNRTYGENVS